MNNPFEQINSRLLSIESILLQVQKSIRKSDNNNGEEDVILDIEGAANHIKLSVPTIHVLSSKKKIPVIKKGKKLLFSKKELTTWLMEGRRQTLSAIQHDSDRC